MVSRLLMVAACVALAATATPRAQSDLDALMSRVLSRRDDNWKKLQQYTLNERETVQITALAVFRLYGFQREYLWFPRGGFFIRSPLEADGVKIAEADRQKEEDKWLRRAQAREKRMRQPRRQDRCAPAADATHTDDTGGPPAGSEPLDDAPFAASSVEDIVNQSFEPDFIRSANFLEFKFDAGQYGLAGRERMLERDVLKIEYYPTVLFRDDDDRCPKRAGANGERRRDSGDDDDFDEKFEAKMNKSSLVTLWVDPAEQQILRYEFRNIDMDFLPARRIVRIDGLTATMQMSEPFPNVWLPASIDMRFRVTTAAGPLEGRYDVKYRDYRLPTVTGRVR
jgi:hypothetical protein